MRKHINVLMQIDVTPLRLFALSHWYQLFRALQPVFDSCVIIIYLFYFQVSLARLVTSRQKYWERMSMANLLIFGLAVISLLYDISEIYGGRMISHECLIFSSSEKEHKFTEICSWSLFDKIWWIWQWIMLGSDWSSEYFVQTRSILGLLMSWLLMFPGHQGADSI